MNKKHGEGYEVNLKTNTQRKGEWRHGKWVRWLSKTQRVGQEQSEISRRMSQAIELTSLTSHIDVHSDAGSAGGLGSPHVY